MKRLRVLMTKNFFDEDLAYLKARLSPHVELIKPADFSPPALAEAVRDDIHVMLGDTLTKEILDQGKSVRLIQIPWSGLDRLDFALLRQYRVPVCNSHSNSPAVAEMAVALLLAAAKKIPLHDARLRQGNWMRPQRDVPHMPVPPTLIAGKTVGFVGCGSVARRAAAMLSGFGMRFLAMASQARSDAPAPFEAVLGPASKHELAERSDFVVVAAPLTAGTRGVIDASFFQRMRTSAYLINVARGEIVVEDALFEALTSRRIAGAAIDTWYQYPKSPEAATYPSAKHPFHELDNLVLSPHRSGYAEGDLPHLADVVTNLNRLAAGEPLINIVNLAAGF